jgi:hypothetical protein
VLPVVALVVLAGAALPDEIAGISLPGAESAVAEPACPLPEPTTVAGYQALFDAKTDSEWAGADQATSLRLPDDRVLWLFGDTLQGQQRSDGGYAEGTRMVRNSMLVQDGGCLSAVPGPDGDEVIPDAENGDFYWPQSATLDGGKLVVVAARTVRTSPRTSAGQVSSMDFAGVGHEAAVFGFDEGGMPVFERMAPLPGSGTSEHTPQYGAALAGDGTFHYLYSSRKHERPLVFGKEVGVARAPVGHLLDLAQWQYWDGSDWSADPAAVTPIVSAAPAGWSTSFSVFRQDDGSFGYVTKRNEFLDDAVIAGVAPGPTGPFGRVTVGSWPSGRVPDEVHYTALAHPHLRLADGSLLATISRNSTDSSAVLADTSLYRPQFFSIG